VVDAGFVTVTLQPPKGRVLSNTVYYDGATLARQIGMLPHSGSVVEHAMLSMFDAVTWLRQRLSQHSARG
jgi:hypothetical protein